MEADSIPDLLATVEHRPWPLPVERWVMAQTWHDLLFAHWDVPARALRGLILPTLDIDLYEGSAWLGVVPFRMSGIRLRGVPALPGLSAFPELNVRTYVTQGGRPGVYFFSLDAGNRLAVRVARRWFHLPYYYARMTLRTVRDGIEYASHRIDATPNHVRGDSSNAEFVARYRPTGEMYRARHATLEHWLTERYCLYAADSRQRIFRGEIHHRPWPLQPAEAEFTRNTMTAPLGLLLPQVPPLLHFARRLDVLIWPPRRLPDPSA